MANTFVVSRNHLIFGLCLPLAVLLGYLLAEPMESSSLAVVVMVLSVLVVPVLMRWHHLLLVLCWNATICPQFLPGRPDLWMAMGFTSLLFAVLGRAVNPNRKFLHVPALTWSLASLLVVVFCTAYGTGGIGVHALGSSTYGGKGYFFLLAAVVGYFALTSQVIPRRHAPLYVALFFLSGLTSMISTLAYLAGPGASFLYDFFPPNVEASSTEMPLALGGSGVRMSGLMQAGFAVFYFLLARWGVTGLFDLGRPWRLALLLGAGFVSMYGGFRSAVMFQLVIFAFLFWIEGLWRTRYLALTLGVGLAAAAVFLPFADRMPLSVQRAVSFLPVKVDPLVKQSAQVSTEWRLEIWKNVWPDVPRYLFKGKGYALDPHELYGTWDNAVRGYARSTEVAAMAGDYHNGPLSVVIPFGIYGVAAFVWFLAAGVRVLLQNYRCGDPELRTINGLLLSLFVTRIIFFFFVFGALYHDLFQFTGLAGLSVALNGGVRRPDPEVEPAAS